MLDSARITVPKPDLLFHGDNLPAAPMLAANLHWRSRDLVSAWRVSARLICPIVVEPFNERHCYDRFL